MKHMVEAEQANICLTRFVFRMSWNKEMLYRHCFPAAFLRKATVTFVMSRPSAWNNSAPNGRILMKLDI
jgi:hypothetical protein